MKRWVEYVLALGACEIRPSLKRNSLREAWEAARPYEIIWVTYKLCGALSSDGMVAEVRARLGYDATWAEEYAKDCYCSLCNRFRAEAPRQSARACATDMRELFPVPTLADLRQAINGEPPWELVK